KNTKNNWPPLIRSLLAPEFYDHPVGKLTVIETHISYVILTGDYAYKVKKPVDLGFVNFSTLAKRRFYCHEEVRLNQRLAPQLYLGVVILRGSEDNPHLGDEGPIIEYAVKMRQFDVDHQLDTFVLNHTLKTRMVDNFAHNLALFHASVERAPADSTYGSGHIQRAQVMNNFALTEDCARRWSCSGAHQILQEWSEEALACLSSRFAERVAGGFIRECHGDLHLGNLALIDGKITAFDCLEFNPELRWVDVISEIAFLDMDLRLHGLRGLANRFLNKYLEHTGDYPGAALLSHFRVYRAMVRAKVACLRETQGATSILVRDFTDHIALAQRFVQPDIKPALLITHGLSGSGKTTLTDHLLNQLDAIRIRSDVERKRLFQVGKDPSGDGAVQDRYSAAAIERTYGYLLGQAEPVLKAGHTALLDATFLKRAQRGEASRMAARLGVPFVILDIRAPDEVLRRRINARLSSGGDASEATTDVLTAQRRNREELSVSERPSAITLNTGQPIDFAQLADDISGRGG
ncbi:MAG: AAA family ATPase, partial [Gammaproteobacteria bacterium]|nr:AAA family ATPase [Gammaproteobacteria bacterium]